MRNYKALVCRSQRVARQVANAFGLDRNEWVLLSPGSALAGYRFSQVVIAPSDDPMTGRLQEWFDHLLKVKMRPEDQANVLWL